jgi:hypothetical protein
MGRHRSGASIGVGVLVAGTVIAGCSFDPPLPTYDGVLDQGTGFDGILHFDGTCLWVESVDVSRERFDELNILWPAGYRSRGRPLEIVDASGEVIAREGDLVSFGIGETKQGALAGCPARLIAPATEIVEVNGVNVYPRTHSPTPYVDRPVTR